MSVSDYECLMPAQRRGQPTVGGLPTLPTRSHNQICKGKEDKGQEKDNEKTQTKATTITNLPAQCQGQPAIGWPPSPASPTDQIYTIHVDCGLP